MKNLNEEINKMKHLFNFKKGDVITESLLNEQDNKTIKINLKEEGWDKIPKDLLPKDLLSTDAPNAKCQWTANFLIFEHKGVTYEVDVDSIAGSIRGSKKGEFICGTNDYLIEPINHEGKTYEIAIGGVSAREKLTNVKSGDKTPFGGFISDDGNLNKIMVNNGGSWVVGDLSFKQMVD